MKKWMKIALIAILGIYSFFMISVFLGPLPIPLVPVFYPQSTRLIGFITCNQLEQRTWYRCHSSGEFNGCEPYMGVEMPLIYELIFSRNCPDFIPPTYCGTC